VPADEAGVARAVAALHAGRLVAFPTETVYGLGGLARDAAAVEAIYRLKGRPSGHPLIVHLPAGAALDSWFDPVPPAAGRLAADFWPGPLTIVARRANHVPELVSGGHATVALRCPGHLVAAALLDALADGVAAPSANRFGRISPTRAEHVADEFPDEDLLILDGGPCALGLESTILDLSGAEPRLLRPGAITRAQLEQSLGRAITLAGVSDRDAPPAPGRLETHYAPTAPVRLVSAAALPRTAGPADALLLRTAMTPPGTQAPVVRLPADPAGYACGLYDALRRLDAGGPAGIVIERPPDEECWSAVLDRLGRAAGPRGDGPPRQAKGSEEQT